MGKVLKILGIIFLVIILLFVGLMIWGHGEGEEQMERFFGAVATNDPAKVIDLMHEDAKKQVDPPVLKKWMEWVNLKLGKFKELNVNGLSTSVKAVKAGTLKELSGIAEFEKGQAKVKLVLLGDKILSFEIEADVLKGSWLQIAEDDETYRNRAKKFITHLIDIQPDEALAMMHVNLREKITSENVIQGMTNFEAKSGKLKAIKIVDEKFTDTKAGRILVIWMECQFEKGNFKAYVQFGFGYDRGNLMAFKLPAE